MVRLARRDASRPLFLPTGARSYQRVVLPIAPEFGGQQAAEVAFDLSHLLSAPLIVLLVQPPQWLRDGEGSTTGWVQEMADVRRRHVEIVPLDGNPLRHVVRQARHDDLVVLGSAPGRRSGLFRPDPLLFLAERLRCSALLVPEIRL